MIRSKHAVALILVLAFLITVCSLGFAVMVLFQSQHGITHSYIGLDEVRYAEEVAWGMGFGSGGIITVIQAISRIRQGVFRNHVI